MKRISRKPKIIGAVLSAVLVLYMLTGFYVLPRVLCNLLPDKVKEKTGLQLQVQDIHINPFSFIFEIDALTLNDTNQKPLLAFERLSINLELLSSILQQGLVFDEITLIKPIIHVERTSDGSLNFEHLNVKPTTASTPKDQTDALALSLTQLQISEGRIEWQDHENGHEYTESLIPVNLNIKALNTLGQEPAGLELSLTIASGGHLNWQGNLDLQKLSSTGSIHLEDLNLSKLWDLGLQDQMPAKILDGHLTFHAEYQVETTGNGFELKLNNGDIELTRLDISETKQEKDFLKIPDLSVKGISADLQKKHVRIEALNSSNATLVLRREEDGSMNYQTLLPTANSATAPTSTDNPTENNVAPWQVNLDELLLNNYQLQFTDQTRKPVTSIKLGTINVDLRKFGNTSGDRLPLAFSSVLNNTGKINVNGDIRLTPFNATLAVGINDIELKDFQSYFADYLNLEWIDGDLSSHGNLQLTAIDPLQLLFQGDLDISHLITRDNKNHKDFIKWDKLQLQQIDIDLAKQNYSLSKVVFDQPYLRFQVKKDKSTNLDSLPVSQLQKTTENIPTNPAPAPVTTENNTQKPIISIGKIAFNGGYSDFADYSLILPFVAQMNALNGEVDGFTSDQNAPFKLDLQGKVYDLAQVNIKGSYQLQNNNSDITLKFTHLPLPMITPYMAEFAGYKIEKGQMSLDLHYQIDKGQLTAQNNILIDQLTLGEHIENPNASSLPLELAIALLKDSEGKIKLDFPVTGSLDDPQFSISALITDVLGNFIENLVSAPFKAFGSLLDDDNDYSVIKFKAGRSELNSEETAKLEQLGNAMQSKPELTLDIKGMSFQIQDWPEMRFDALVDVLKNMKSAELRETGQHIRAEYIQISDADYYRLLEQYFKQTFPQQIEYGLLGKPRLKSQPDGDFYELARIQLEATLQPEPQRLTDLAVARASTIAKYLMEKTHLDISRIYILAPELDPGTKNEIVAALSLNVAH